MVHPNFLLAGINSAILCKEVTGEKLSHKDSLLSLETEIRQSFKNTDASYDKTDDIYKKKQCQLRQCNKIKSVETCYKCKNQTCCKCISKVWPKLLCKNVMAEYFTLLYIINLF